MPKLLKQGRVVPDPWRSIGDDDALPADVQVVVSLARWQRERATLLERDGAVGVRLDVTDDPVALSGDLPHLDLIVLTFPAFRDGRAYSQARTLRERLGWTGELRATGDVLRDQLAFMSRCGFDAFEVPDSVDADMYAQARGEVSVHYQPATDGPGVARRGTSARP